MKKPLLFLLFASCLALMNTSCNKNDQNVYTMSLNGSYSDHETGKTEQIKLKFKNIILMDYNVATGRYYFNNGKQITQETKPIGWDSPTSWDLWLIKQENNKIGGGLVLTHFTSQLNEHTPSMVTLKGDMLNDEEDLSVSGTFSFEMDRTVLPPLGDTTGESLYYHKVTGEFTLKPR